MKWYNWSFNGRSYCLAAALLLAPISGSEARVGDAKLIRSGSNEITFEISVPEPELAAAGDGRVRVMLPGYGTASPPGAFEIPVKTFHVAIPPGADVRASAAVHGEDRLGALLLARVPAERFIRGENDIPSTEIYYPPDPWRDGGYPPIVVAAEPALMGRQRVLPVRVHPLLLDGEGVRLVRRLTVSVTWAEMPTPPGLPRTAPVSSRWKRIYDGLLVNPEAVPEYIRPLRMQRIQRSMRQEIKSLRLSVPETGRYAVRADSLIEMGLSAGLSPGQIALKKRYYDEGEPDLVREVDIPMLVINGSSSTEQVFSDDDLLVFYMLGIKDDADAGDVDAAFTDNNVVWLEEGVAGAFMAEGQPLSAAPGTPQRNTNRSVSRNRKDTFYFKNAGSETDEFYYVTGPAGTSVAVPFDVRNPIGSDDVSVVVRLRGIDSGNTGSTLNFYIRNSEGGSSWIGNGTISRKNAVTYTLEGIDSGLLTEGVNSLMIESSLPRILIVNDLTVDYPSQFRAHDNTIEFAIGPMLLGFWKFRISGFTADHGYLIEITDPFNPIQYELTSAFFEQNGAEYILEFDLDAPTVERRFIVLGDGAGAHLARRLMSVDDTPANLREKTGPYHTLIISHKAFIGEISGYEQWRSAQGYRILTADVDNVYDEFNGGNPSCDAIKRFIRHGFDHWGVEFVLLVGDGSEDHKRLSLPSPLDFIPPYTFGVRVSGEFEDEVTSSDRYYSFLDAAETDPYPDVFVGRFPVGAALELRAMLTKLYRFEDEVEAADSWRRHIILFSDDAWSGRYSNYGYKSYEREFEFSTDEIAGDIDDSLPGGFGIRNLRLSHWTDGPHENPNGDPGQVIYSRTVDSVHTYFTPYLLDRLNEGCLFFSFQGHANRAVLTTEAAFASLKQWDHLRYLYERKPHVFAGFGCHISDFAHHYEGGRPYDGPNGDCFSEQMLLKPGVAAVSSYASNGFEFLHENAVLAETMHRYIFQTPPSDSVPPLNAYTGSHWVLGEAITMAEIVHIGNQPLYGRNQVFRYILLGDPMLVIDPGPPLMELEANWDGNWEAVSPDSFSARHGSNDCILRLKASDVVALGTIALSVNGDSSWTDSLTITKITDQDKTYSRAYHADVAYSVSLTDEELLYRVFTPAGRLAGLFEIPITTTIRLFYNDYLEITPTVESPPTGTFKVTVDFPAYIDRPPVLFFDGLEQDDVLFGVPNPDDSLHWEASFYRENVPGGSHVFTVKVGEFSEDFFFSVTGEDLAMDSFCFPNPFTRGTNITYTLNLPVTSGTVDIYNVSGINVKTIELPPDQLDAANYESPNSIYWDGTDHAGDPVANGTYIYIIQVAKDGTEHTVKGKSVKLE